VLLRCAPRQARSRSGTRGLLSYGLARGRWAHPAGAAGRVLAVRKCGGGAFVCGDAFRPCRARHRAKLASDAMGNDVSGPAEYLLQSGYAHARTYRHASWRVTFTATLMLSSRVARVRSRTFDEKEAVYAPAMWARPARKGGREARPDRAIRARPAPTFSSSMRRRTATTESRRHAVGECVLRRSLQERDFAPIRRVQGFHG
jgi:hypothetical protein